MNWRKPTHWGSASYRIYLQVTFSGSPKYGSSRHGVRMAETLLAASSLKLLDSQLHWPRRIPWVLKRPDAATKKATPQGGLLVSRQPASVLDTLGCSADGWSECFTWHRAAFAGGYPPTIIAAAAFHNRVRDGSEWDHSAMDTRIDLLPG